MLGMQWRIQGRGWGGGGSPLYFQTKLRPKEPKKIFCIPDPSSLSQVLDFHTKPPPPPALFQGLDPALVCIQINGGCLVGQLTNQ